MSTENSVLDLQPKDLQRMLAAKVHIGNEHCNKLMEDYCYNFRVNEHVKRNSEEPKRNYIINLGKTWEKIVLAARILVTVDNPRDICVISGRKHGQRGCFKFAQHVGTSNIDGRFTPGTFTNQIQKKFLEPRILLISDPKMDKNAVKEASFVNIPTIAFCNTDNDLTNVDVAIPCNNAGRESLGLMFWLLAREVLRMRGEIPRTHDWEVLPDLFMYRDPNKVAESTEETEEGEEGNTSEQANNESSNADWDQSGVQAEETEENEATNTEEAADLQGTQWD